MSLVTIVWSMVASACLTMAVLHWLVWYKQRTEWANLFFAMTAMSTAILAGTELWVMRAETPADLAMAMRWAHVPIWLLLVTLVGFVRLYLRAGRAWLAWSFVGLRTLSLLLNFLTGQNLNYREITAVRRIPFLGEQVFSAIGAPNPWMLVGQLSSLAFILFVADASVTSGGGVTAGRRCWWAVASSSSCWGHRLSPCWCSGEMCRCRS
jgi:two-component system, LuxR family, sensor kinase FixL